MLFEHVIVLSSIDWGLVNTAHLKKIFEFQIYKISHKIRFYLKQFMTQNYILLPKLGTSCVGASEQVDEKVIIPVICICSTYRKLIMYGAL